MTTSDDWLTQVTGRVDPGSDCLQLVMPLAQGTKGGSGSFPARCSDGQRWFVKPLNNCQGTPRVVINDFLVGRLGVLIGAPVCTVNVVWIGPDHVGWEFRPGHHLELGFACASREIPGVHEGGQLDHRQRDDNARRHVGIFALYDWCWGNDPQWLFDGADDEKTHSHDHGHYFPSGPSWTRADLVASAAVPHPLGHPTNGLVKAEVERVADRLEQISQAEIGAILRLLPSSWPVTDEELAGIGSFLAERAPAVSTRIRVL